MNKYPNFYMFSLLILIFLSAAGSSYSQKIIFVKPGGDDNNTGTSWDDAFNNLQSALTEAVQGDTIFVAAGIYKPDQGPGTTQGNRSATFQLKSGIVLMGN